MPDKSRIRVVADILFCRRDFPEEESIYCRCSRAFVRWVCPLWWSLLYVSPSSDIRNLKLLKMALLDCLQGRTPPTWYKQSFTRFHIGKHIDKDYAYLSGNIAADKRKSVHRGKGPWRRCKSSLFDSSGPPFKNRLNTWNLSIPTFEAHLFPRFYH